MCKAVDYATVAMQRAQRVGIKILVLGSGAARQVPQGFSHKQATNQFITLLKVLAPIAQRHGVVIVIEPLNRAECNFINSVREATEIVRQIDHASIGVLADFYHCMREGEDAQALIDSGKWLLHCHIAEREKRTPPGVMGDDFTSYFEALQAINYSGGISIECSWSSLSQQVATSVQAVRKASSVVQN